MSPKRSSPCPCGRPNAFAACCDVFHKGSAAPDAESLMRSRYAAFATGNVDYLLATLHPDHDDWEQPEAELRESLRRSVRAYKYMGLTILDTSPPDEQGLARVLFMAKVFESGRNLSFVELSTFATHDGRWKYLSGTSRPLPPRGQDVSAMRIESFA